MIESIEEVQLRCRLTASALLLLIFFPSATLATQDDVKPTDSTMAYQLLTLEQSVRQVPTDVERLFRAALEEATAKALQVNRQPRTKKEAIAVLEVIQQTLVKYNFLQPPEEKDWPQTLGIALTARPFTPEELDGILELPENSKRIAYIDRTKPFYFVDCDMGSQFFIAVGERAGWDIRLVEVPQHNFVRWHISESVKINWDWTRWGSNEDSAYSVGALAAPEDPRLRTLYLRSLDSREARAYYSGLIGSEAVLHSDAERLLQEAVAVLPNHPLTLNNLAWLYATTPEFANEKSSLAVAFGLAAWSMRPYNGNYADTVACAFAADKANKIAEEIEGFAMEHASNPTQLEGFRVNRDRIKKGKLCNP